MRVRLAILLTFLFGSAAHAQLDASSTLLLNGVNGGTTNGDRVNMRESAVDSGRYTIRPKAAAEPSARPVAGKRTVVRERDREEEPPQPVTVTVPPGPTPVPETNSREPVDETAKVIVIPSPRYAPAPPTMTAASGARETPHRLNVIDLSFAPGYLYTNSDSSYFYRRYTTASPTLAVDANVWVSPSFGLHGSFVGTLSGHVNDSFNGSRNVPASQQWFNVGFKTKKFFGADALTPTMTFGLDYLEYQFKVPSDAAIRNKLTTVGVQISLETEIPVNAGRSWTLGILLAPKLQHSEGATTFDLRSGGNVDANAVGISLGGRLLFERRDAIFWKLSYTVEKDLFSGDALMTDPMTGSVPNGVAVTNSFTLLQMGYSWGN